MDHSAQLNWLEKSVMFTWNKILTQYLLVFHLRREKISSKEARNSFNKYHKQFNQWWCGKTTPYGSCHFIQFVRNIMTLKIL
jgi:hypothetical protein